jgi:Flp pilus assembly protein TadG
MRSSFRRLAREDRGATLVEFALAGPLLIGLVFAIFQLGVLFMTSAGMQHAVGEGARRATLFPTPTDEKILSAITEAKFGLDPERVKQLTITRGTETGTAYTEVRMRYEVPLEFVLFKGPTVTLEKSRRAYLQ